MRALAPLCILGFLITASSARAAESINVQTFNPSTSDHFVILEDGFKSEWPKTAQYYFGANYNYVSEPLVALDPTQTFKAYNIIDSIQTIDLMFGVKVSNRFGIFVGLPINFVSYSSDSPANFPKGSATGIGDIKLEGKYRLTNDDSPTSVALIPELHLPTGDTNNFVSDASLYAGLRVAIERQFDTFTLIGNLGFAHASNALYENDTFVSGIDYRNRLIVGIGGFVPFNDNLGMDIEFNNESMIPFDKNLNPNDAYAGLRYATNSGVIYTAGASLGKIGGPGGTDYRFIAGIRYTIFDEKEQAPRPIALSPTPTPAPVVAPVAKAGVIDSNKHATMKNDRIEIDTPIHFSNNSYDIAIDSEKILDDVSALLLRNKTAYKKILIDGHTSGSGTDKYNLNLSLARARSVKAYLVKRGIPAAQLEPRGFGMRKPKVAKKNPNADSINRRVEFNMVK